MDSDGWIDLFVTLQWGTPRCWRNLGGERFEEASEALGFTAAGAGWWNSIASADFNGDGQPDYVVGNVGLNTRYQASCDRHIVLLRAAMDATENSQILEAEYHDGRLLPVRGRSTTERVMPWIGAKWPTFKRYADAPLEDIFGAGRIAFSDGSTQTAEVAACSGYCSQSRSTLFFGTPPSCSPKTIRIRWPWGRLSEGAAPARSGVVVISSPLD